MESKLVNLFGLDKKEFVNLVNEVDNLIVINNDKVQNVYKKNLEKFNYYKQLIVDFDNKENTKIITVKLTDIQSIENSETYVKLEVEVKVFKSGLNECIKFEKDLKRGEKLADNFIELKMMAVEFSWIS